MGVRNLREGKNFLAGAVLSSGYSELGCVVRNDGFLFNGDSLFPILAAFGLRSDESCPVSEENWLSIGASSAFVDRALIASGFE